MLKHEEGYCKYCSHNEVDECHHAVMKDYCPTNLTVDSLVDAAEFEQRVAAKLAEAYGTMMDHNEKHSLCQTCRFEVVKTLGCMSTCAETVLRWAQLEVEEEMDAE